MIVEVSRSFEFQAAHFLPNVPTTHKCHRMHGHTWTATLVLAGTPGPETGWLCDFAELDDWWEQTCRKCLDHRTLNETIANPTSEHVAFWIFERLKVRFDRMVQRVTVSENGRSSATVLG